MGSLQSEALDCLEHVQDALCLHPLQDCTQCTEGPRPASSSTERTHAHTQIHTGGKCKPAVSMWRNGYTKEDKRCMVTVLGAVEFHEEDKNNSSELSQFIRHTPAHFFTLKLDRSGLNSNMVSVCVCACLTCSAPWWDDCQTAAVVSAPQQLCWSYPYHQWECPPLASRGNGTDAPLEPCSPENTDKGNKNRFR